LSSGTILDIFEDSRGNVWIGTSTGINLLNRNDGTFRRYGVKDGLPNNTVQAIEEDENGNLWLSTNNGICKFRNAINIPDTAEFLSYHVSDGLSGNEYVRRSVYKHEDGWLYFGGTKGYTYFHPDRIYENLQAPQVVITDFSLLKNSDEEKDLEYKGDMNLLERLDLDYDQCDFVIVFAALNYINPGLNRYKFILEGYDTQWREVGQQREAILISIPGNMSLR